MFLFRLLACCCSLVVGCWLFAVLCSLFCVLCSYLGCLLVSPRGFSDIARFGGFVKNIKKTALPVHLSRKVFKKVKKSFVFLKKKKR